ncbi:uncharacterized protein LOC134608189 [Pelobates fuscus]|uniref:uncharacterized protein LOC134608189 n=1 Tax=Pelobates fuscus TaxID=191477 RepID=UPI002FE44950
MNTGQWMRTLVVLGLFLVIVTSLTEDAIDQTVEVYSPETSVVFKTFEISPQNEEDNKTFQSYFSYLFHPVSRHSLSRFIRWFNEPYRNSWRKSLPFAFHSPKDKDSSLRIRGAGRMKPVLPNSMEFIIKGTIATCQKFNGSLDEPCTLKVNSIVTNCSASLNRQTPLKYTVKCYNGTTENLGTEPDDVTQIFIGSNEGSREEGSGTVSVETYSNLSRCLGCIFWLI